MKRWILFSAALLAALTATAAALQMDQQALAGKLVRLHVVANSDSDQDQAWKLQVRDAVLEVADGLDRDGLAAALPQIEQAAEARLRALGSSQEVCVTLAEEHFPTRKYDTFALPAGVYTSLRVVIGDGAGKNWWCVTFPSICLCASAEELKAAAASAGFTEQEIAFISEEKPYQLKFWTLEQLQRLKIWLNSKK